MDILQNSVVVRVDITVWTGKAKLSRADLPPDANIPPEDLAVLGQKRLIDPETLRPFGMLKTRAARLMDKYGVKFLSGWLVADDVIHRLDAELRDIQDDFKDARDTFIQSYSSNVAAWVDQHPDWASMLEAVLPAVDDMERKFAMSWQMYRIQPVETKGSTTEEEVARVVGADVETLTKALREVYATTFEGRTTTVTGRTLSPLRDFITKCSNLSGIYPSACYMAQALERLMDGLTLPLSPSSVDFTLFDTVLKTMADPVHMSTCIDKWMQAAPADPLTDIEALVQRPDVTPVEEAAPEPAPAPEPDAVPQDTSRRSLMSLMDDLF